MESLEYDSLSCLFLFLNINCVLEITLYEHIGTPSSPQQHSIRTAWCRTSLEESAVTAVVPCVLPALVMKLQAMLMHHDCACCLLLGLYVL